MVVVFIAYEAEVTKAVMAQLADFRPPRGDSVDRKRKGDPRAELVKSLEEQLRAFYGDIR